MIRPEPVRWPSPARLVKMALVMEGAMLPLAAAWGHLRGIPWWSALHLEPQALLGLPLGLLLLATNATVLHLTRRFGSSGAHLLVDELLVPMVRPLGLWHMLVISIASGLCEEALFRGVVQAEVGVVLASLIFGILHVPERRYLVGGVQSAFSGVYLGLLYALTADLTLVAVAHGANNLAGMTWLKWGYRGPNDERVSPRPGEDADDTRPG